MTKRRQVGAEERDHQEVDQHGRAQESQGEAGEHGFHPQILAGDLELAAFHRLGVLGIGIVGSPDARLTRTLLAELADDRVHVVAHVPQIAAIDAQDQVDRRGQVGVRDLGRYRCPAERGDIPQGHRLFLDAAGDRHVQEGRHRLDVPLRILHADVILIVADRVDPEVRLVELDARVERGHDVFHHVRLVEAQIGGFLAVHVDDELGIIESLKNAAIDDARHALDLLLNVLRDLPGLFERSWTRCGY